MKFAPRVVIMVGLWASSVCAKTWVRCTLDTPLSNADAAAVDQCVAALGVRRNLRTERELQNCPKLCTGFPCSKCIHWFHTL